MDTKTLFDLTEASQQQLLIEWNSTQTDYSHVCVHELFEAQVERTPDAMALVAGEQALTYQALNQRANQLAHYLQGLGVKPDSLVAICLERSFDMIVGMLAILKAGGAYVPLDPVYPRERLEFMLKDAEVEILLTNESLLSSLPESTHVTNLVCLDRDWEVISEKSSQTPQTAVQPNHLAYVIYTSGSTGQPKGGAMEHHSLVNLLWWHAQTRPASFGVTLQFCAISFDFSFHEIFSTLCFGGPLVLVSEEIRRNPFALAKFIHDNKIEKLFLPVTALQQLAEAVDSETVPASSRSSVRRLREVITTGEQLQITPAMVDFFRQTGAMLHNHYGATEFQDATTFTLSGDPTDWPALPPIGRPLSNVQVYILDESGQPVPHGEIGELYIGGAGVARGYLNRPELTKERFIPNPFSPPKVGGGWGGARLYKTGDLARYRADGTIENLGRADYQVKIRGVRIELGEIEAVLAKHPAVRENAVMAHESASTGHKRLVAYVVSREESLSEQLLHSYLEERLPDYMLPEAFVVLDEMPLTPSGKINRRALPAPTTFRRTLATPVSMPQSETEQLLAEIWQEVLKIETVGIHDNFFDIGATSLLLIQAHKRLSETFGSLPTVTLFQYPTIHALAQHLSQPLLRHKQTARKSKKIEQNPARTDIAIIGMSGRFPGAEDIDTFWQNLRDGVESISFFSDSELSDNDPTLLLDPNYVKAGAVLPNIDLFDASFFGISPKEAATMDPQQRLLLECAWEAFENAGYNPETYPGQVGVYAGSSMSTYLVNNVGPNLGYSANRPLIEADMLQLQVKLGNDRNYLPTRISYKLNLKGPSVNVQTACSTALVAVHLARQSLLNGECDMALAGGISIIVPHKGGYLYEEGMIRSPDGHCRAFDAQAAGTLFGNGGGLVLLKRLDEAVADGDHIVAIIKGSAINNDGAQKVGFTAPSYERQVAVIEDALAVADVDASTITYVEAHGTGTKLGDPIEMAALTQAFHQSGALTRSVSKGSQQERSRQYCAVGSVKTNIGHLDEAAGIAGLIKTALALKHKQIPPSLHFKQPNPQIDFENSPFYVKTELSEWQTNGIPRRAGVSSFGMGGTNSHLVLEEAPKIEQESGHIRPLHLLALSAKTPQALEQLAQRYVDYLASEAPREAGLANICFTANMGRKHFTHRAAFVVESNEQLREQLERFLDSGAHGQEVSTQTKKIAFLFTGQGSQYVDMGRQLYESQPIFRQTIDRCDEILRPYLSRSLLSVLYPDYEVSLWEKGQPSPINETAYTQPALFAVEYALYQLWKSWGIQPDVVMGHSVGEYVAACVAGVFSLEDGLKLIAARARLMGALPQDGAMVSFLADETTIQQAIAPYELTVSIAAINGPQSVVISGIRSSVMAIAEQLAGQGIKSRQLKVSHAFHSPLMDPMLDEFRQVTASISYSKPKLPLVSNMTGKLAGTEISRPDYWVRHVREAVRFADGMGTLYEQGINVFLEIGPKATLLGMASFANGAKAPEGAGTRMLAASRSRVPTSTACYLPSLHESQNDWQQILTTLGELYVRGVSVDSPRQRGAEAFDREHQRRKVALPTYPFQRERYWLEISNLEQSATGTQELTETSIIRLLKQGDIDQLSKLIDLTAASKEEQKALPKFLAMLVAQHQRELLAASSKEWFYQIEWQPQPREVHEWQVGASDGSWLIVADDEGIGAALANKLSLRGHQAILVVCGSEYHAPHRARQLQIATINPSEPKHSQWLFNDLQRTKLLQETRIIYFAQREESSHVEVPQRVLRLSGGLLHLVQALIQSEQSEQSEQADLTRRLWVVTQNAQAVHIAEYGQKETLKVEQRPLWGLARTIAAEHPEWRTTCIDLDESDEIDQISSLLQELEGEECWRPVDKENQIAYRDGKRYVARLRRAKIQMLETTGGVTTRIRGDGSYLITGGLGGLGLAVAEQLVAQGAKHLVLAGRRGVTSKETQDLILQMEAAGAKVQVVRADVLYDTDVARLLAISDPLRGIIHAAGVSDAGLLSEQTVERFEKVMASKVMGTWHLHRLTQEMPLDFFVCFSSMASLLETARESSYAAANAFQDGLMQQRRALGLPGFSINWGTWAEVGMAANASVEYQKLGMIPPKQGAQISIDLALEEPFGQIAVTSVNWPEFYETFFQGKEPTFLRELIQQKHVPSHETKEGSPAPSALRIELEKAPPRERYQRLIAYIQDEVAQVLKLSRPPAPQQGFLEMGMDSLMVVEFRNRLHSMLALTLPSTLLFKYPSIEELTEHLSALLTRHTSDLTELREAATHEEVTSGDEKQIIEKAPLEPMSLAEDEIDILMAEKFQALTALLEN